MLSLVASPKRNAKVVSQDMRRSILCSLQCKSTSETRRKSVPSSCKKPTWGSAQGAQGGTELSHSPLHPASTIKWVISFRERERNTHKAELLKNPRWRQRVRHRPCVPRAKWIGQTMPRQKWSGTSVPQFTYLWSRVIRLVLISRKYGKEAKHSKCLVLPRKSQAFSDDPFAKCQSP